MSDSTDVPMLAPPLTGAVHPTGNLRQNPVAQTRGRPHRGEPPARHQRRAALQTTPGLIDPKHGLDNYVGELAAMLQAIDDAEAGARVAIVFDATSPIRA